MDIRFTLDGLAQGRGSCLPIGLEAPPRGGVLEIPLSEVEIGARYF